MKLIKNAFEIKNEFASLYGKVSLTQIDRYNKLIKKFKKCFRQDSCYLCSSPGRVEIVGNHTDHNGGKVLGCTVSIDVLACFLPNSEGKVVIKSQGYADMVFTLDELNEKEVNSRGMAKGVLKGFAERGYKIGGFYAVITSSVPSGAGVSSSAAFELMVASIQNELYNEGKISPEELARIAQYSEINYFNKPCGLLDQGVIAYGGVVGIDFKDGFSAERVDADFGKYNVVVVNTGGSHANLTEHYAAIPAEMKKVAEYFGKSRLIDVDEKEFFNAFDDVTATVGKRPALRAKHFFEENARVEKAKDSLKKGDVKGFLQQVNDSGVSSEKQLQNCTYEGGSTVICDAVALGKKNAPSGASRVHGGGFAGTILNFVPISDTNGFVKEMEKVFGKGNVHVLSLRSVGTKVL